MNVISIDHGPKGHTAVAMATLIDEGHGDKRVSMAPSFLTVGRAKYDRGRVVLVPAKRTRPVPLAEPRMEA